MKRTTVILPDSLDARLRMEARRTQRSIAEITREALETHLGTTHHVRQTPQFFAVDDATDATDSERVDELLGRGFGS